MPADDFIKAIEAKPPKLKAVQDQLKKEKPNVKWYPDPKDKSKWSTPLHVAARAGSLAVVDALLGAAADVTATDHEGATPLHWAAAGHGKDAAGIAESLLKKKAKPDVVNTAKLTPLHIAAQAGATAVVAPLASAAGEAGLESQTFGQTPLMLACHAGHMETVDALMKAGAKLGTVDADGCTALLRLVLARQGNEARMLLMKGDCAVNAQAGQPAGRTALMAAVMDCPAGQEPDMSLVDALLIKGASPDTQDPGTKDTPIMHALSAGRFPLAVRLIKASKQVDVRNKSQLTALSLALSVSAPDDVIGAILAAGADLAADGQKLLSNAMDSKRDGLVAEFIKAMKPPALAALDVHFKSLAARGLPKAALAYVTRFESEQSDKYPIDDQGNTNLHLLAEHGAPYDLVLGLIKMGLGPSTQNKAGDTPLHIAARAGHVEVCRALLDGGADALKRNGKNRRAREQPKIPDNTKDFLGQAEEDAKARKLEKQSELWDDKMRATQTESALIVRGL